MLYPPYYCTCEATLHYPPIVLVSLQLTALYEVTMSPEHFTPLLPYPDPLAVVVQDIMDTAWSLDVNQGRSRTVAWKVPLYTRSQAKEWLYALALSQRKWLSPESFSNHCATYHWSTTPRKFSTTQRQFQEGLLLDFGDFILQNEPYQSMTVWWTRQSVSMFLEQVSEAVYFIERYNCAQ